MTHVWEAFSVRLAGFRGFRPIGAVKTANSAKDRKVRIDEVQTSSDCLTDRGRLALFARYVTSIPELSQHICFQEFPYGL